MKIEVELLTMENGQLKEVKIFGEVFSIHPKRQVEKTVMSTQEANELGVIVCKLRQSSLRSKPAEAVKQVIDKPYNEIKQIVKGFYPAYKESSLRTITRLYINYAKGEYSDTEIQKSRKKYRKYRRRPQGAVSFNKGYQLWIYEEYVQKVKLAVNKFGLDYKPNLQTIGRETGLSRGKVLATLQYMKNEGLIRKVIKNRIGQAGIEVIYQPVIRPEG
jgi:hypothetical protein